MARHLDGIYQSKPQNLSPATTRTHPRHSKKPLLVIGLLVVCGLGIVVSQQPPQKSLAVAHIPLRPAVATPTASESPLPAKVVARAAIAAPTPTPLSIPSSPGWRLVIPSLGIMAAVQNVGLTPEGLMDVPTNTTDVGWYQDGTSPGSVGNAVIDGHRNGPGGSTAVFSNLLAIRVGDEVIVEKESGIRKKFVVTGKEEYRVDSAPLERIFGDTDQKHLNLITCSGTWDAASADYTKRLVVFTKLVSS